MAGRGGHAGCRNARRRGRRLRRNGKGEEHAGGGGGGCDRGRSGARQRRGNGPELPGDSLRSASGRRASLEAAAARSALARPARRNRTGSILPAGGSAGYDPTRLVSKGAVVVTTNYRIGMLGFLAHPALTGESPEHASGDYGLMDQQAALAWVQRNIAHFGGDPDNVTIFGQSAGGLSVHSQLASPLAAGLFDRAIVQSGAYSLTQPSLAAAEAAGQAFATRAGCADQSVACLRDLPVSSLLAANTASTIVPNVDGNVLTRSIGSAFATGQFNHVPVIEGSTHDEWRLFVASTEAATGVPLTADRYEAAIAATLG